MRQFRIRIQPIIVQSTCDQNGNGFSSKPSELPRDHAQQISISRQKLDCPYSYSSSRHQGRSCQHAHNGPQVLFQKLLELAQHTFHDEEKSNHFRHLGYRSECYQNLRVQGTRSRLLCIQCATQVVQQKMVNPNQVHLVFETSIQGNPMGSFYLRVVGLHRAQRRFATFHRDSNGNAVRTYYRHQPRSTDRYLLDKYCLALAASKLHL